MAERALITRPEAGDLTWFQRKRRIPFGAPKDVYEAEADRAADAVVSGRARFDQGLSLSHIPVAYVQRQGDDKPKSEGDKYEEPAPIDAKQQHQKNKEHEGTRIQQTATGEVTFGAALSTVNEVLTSPGEGLDDATLAFMESRFGHDFSRVRIHTDERAARSAEAVDAYAYASGQDVVFGVGTFRPNTGPGRHLLAHELAHLVQQQGLPGRAPALFKTKPKPVPFYQEALDELEEERKATRTKLSTGGVIDMFGRVPVMEKFVDFLKAIDRMDVQGTRQRLDEFLKADTTRLSPFFPSDALANTTITRVLLLGLAQDAERFRQWYLRHEKESQLPSMRRKDFLSERFIWEQVLQELTNRIPESGAEPALQVHDALLLLFGQMRDEMVGLDQQAIEVDQRRRVELSRATQLPLDHDVTISVYFASLLGLLKQAFAAIQIAYQVVLDQAIDDLAAGKGSKYLDIAKDRLENRLRPLIDPKDDRKKVVGLTVEVTRSEFKKGGGKHLDFFAKGKAATRRAVGIEFYDKEMMAALASEKEMDLARIYLIRREQVAVLERIYGLAKDEKTGKPTAETQENAAAIAKLKKQGLRLNTDDDWRLFLLEKYGHARAKGAKPAEALASVIKLLESFLHAFTLHTPFNIEDFGDNQLTRQFPRAMTGQLIQDCGVYALRIAYILSLLRQHKELQLRFRFIVLPVHVGLIITGKDLPTYIAHNDQIVEFRVKDIAQIQDAWIRTDEKGEPRKPTGKAEEEQFVAELGGAEFISGVDLPFKLLAAPKPKGGPQAIKQDLWSAYTRQVDRTKLFGPETSNPKSPFYQFHLRYLKVLELTKENYNQWLVPFWNGVARETWLKYEPSLTKGLAEINAAMTVEQRNAVGTTYDKQVRKYLDDIEPHFHAVEDKFQSVILAQTEMFMVLQEHPEVIAKGIRITHSARLEQIIHTPWWSRIIYDHFSDLGRRTQVQAPFVAEPGWLWPID